MSVFRKILLPIMLVFCISVIIYSTNILGFRDPDHLSDDVEPNFVQQNNGGAKVEEASTALVLDEQLNKLKVYKSDKLDIEISYPVEWGVVERFDVDAYEDRKSWLKDPVRFNHDFYSSVSFYPLSDRSYFGIHDLSVSVYPNPRNLSLYEYFKGRSEPLGDPRDYPDDTFMSTLIDQGEIVSFGKYQGKAVRDMSYSDVGNQIYRKIYLTQSSGIYEISLGYIYGEGFQLPSDPILVEGGFWITPPPPLFEAFVKKIGDSLAIY